MQCHSLFLSAGFIEDVSEMASAAVLAVEVSGHENAGAAFLVGALTAKTRDLAILVNLKRKGCQELVRKSVELEGLEAKCPKS